MTNVPDKSDRPQYASSSFISSAAMQDYRSPILQLQHVDDWDPADGPPKIPVIPFERNGMAYFEPLAAFLPEYKSVWLQVTILTIFGSANIAIFRSRDHWKQWKSLKARQGMDQSIAKKQQSADVYETLSLGPHLSNTAYMADAVDETEHKVQQSLNFQATVHQGSSAAAGCEYQRLKTHKRSFVQVEVEERSDVKRAKRRDCASRDSKLYEATVQDFTMASKPSSACLAEEQHHQSLEIEQRCFERSQEECRIPSVVLGSIDHVQRNAQQPWITNTDRSSEGSSAIFAYARQDSQALELHLSGQTDRPRRSAIRLDPLGSMGDGTVEVLQPDQHTIPSVYNRCDKIPMLEGGGHRQSALPNSAEWQRLLAPEALQLLFPSMSMHKQETTYMERTPALAVSNSGLEMKSGLHCGGGNFELLQETTIPPASPSETCLTDTMCHFNRFVTPLPTDTQHLTSSLASSQHEANTDRPQINIDAPDFGSHYGSETMASKEGTTGAPHQKADESTADIPYSHMNDQDLISRQLPQPDEDLESIEDFCQRQGLSLDEADKWLGWMMQRGCEGYCMPSCTGECKKYPGQQDQFTASDPHASAGEGADSGSGEASKREGPGPGQTTSSRNTQMQSQRNDDSLETTQAEGIGTAISAMRQAGENEAAIQDLARVEEADAEFDINQYFDFDRFEQDNEDGNLHWTGRTY